MSKTEVSKLFNGEEIKEDMTLYHAESKSNQNEIEEITFSFTLYRFKYFKDWSGRIKDLSKHNSHVEACVEEVIFDDKGNEIKVHPKTLFISTLKYCGETKKKALEGLKQKEIDEVKSNHQDKMKCLDNEFVYIMRRVKQAELEMQEESLSLKIATTVIEMEMAKY